MVVRGTVDLEGRRHALAGLLSSSGSLRIEDLGRRFKVSTMTIRRDLQALEDDGLVRRVRGGAVSGAEPFEAREHRAGRAKQQIAAKLATLVPSGGFGVCMDASSTVCTLAASMPRRRQPQRRDGWHRDLHDPEPRPAGPCVPHRRTEGPQRRQPHRPRGVLGLKQFSFARAFLSAAAVDPFFGTSEFSAEECEIKRLMAELSDHVVMAVDSQKLGTGAAARCLPWDGIDLMVTELEVGDARLDPYRDHVELL